MDNLVFNICERYEKGSKLRRNGEIPCIIYGNDRNKSLAVKMTKKEMIRLLKYPKSSIVSLKLNGILKKCIVKETQQDAFGKIIHIDFQSINKGDVVKLKIPINFVGQEVLGSKGLLLESFITDVELQGEADKFPDSLTVDLSNLEEGSQILVKDLSIPSEIVLESNPDLVVAKISYNSGNKDRNEEQIE
ncbi:50S ribosomal protein L25 [Clostridium sp.]|uniref:50S ribosomal protein L25 n=1 Tax=Clostridium sp. TaxID=1506 RepID=UPI0025BEA222|nr:50S ribosomal protein L25 [Clostridium sp.]MBS4955459.1 50S ribosomal protein L25 [Clostridium sp.]MDU4882347.1 50S ribosomal protein L25 [Clostridium celatum]MDU7075617.1 50S ribosomal protein L25 [Clostridium celatum]